MAAIKLVARRVEKPWGRRDLPATFETLPDKREPVGEIWFEHPGGGPADLLIKYLFTSDKLSIQVHPNDEAARASGHASGKDEAWLVLTAEPGATIGIGLTQPLDAEALRRAALDGSIERLLDWRPAKAGDSYYTPAGTVHALGAGLTLIEVQQNVNLTYRLYDYGSSRELHLDEAVAVAVPAPYVSSFQPFEMSDGRLILADGAAFVLERWRGPASCALRPCKRRPVWMAVIEGQGGIVNGLPMNAGSAWLVKNESTMHVGSDYDVLVAYPGSGVHRGLRA